MGITGIDWIIEENTVVRGRVLGLVNHHSKNKCKSIVRNGCVSSLGLAYTEYHMLNHN